MPAVAAGAAVSGFFGLEASEDEPEEGLLVRTRFDGAGGSSGSSGGAKSAGRRALAVSRASSPPPGCAAPSSSERRTAGDLRPLIEGTLQPTLSPDGQLRSPVGGSRSSLSVLAPLTLRQEVVLDSALRRAAFQVVQISIRLLPACIIYGGTASMIVCVAFSYRWGVFLSLLLYSTYMCINSWEIVIFGAWGIINCWIQSRNDWYAMYSRRPENGTSSISRSRRDHLREPASPEISRSSSDSWAPGGLREIQWHDVFHVVMVPTYKTPFEVLASSMRALEQFRDARTNMGVCLAFEEREVGCDQKALALMKEYEEQFRFVTAAYHPPNLARHVPGKSSNECWAFSELVRELKAKHGFEKDDPRVIITVIDDDSELHENYFEALTYHFLESAEADRYLTIWQPPIVHFKNYLSQPTLVRTASLFTSLHELACLANPIDCHVPFSSYSLSLLLASAVGGWDPDFISEDWHMMAKCALMTEGRVRTKPIFLPLLNYAPEEDTVVGTVKARWTQATRHALGVSEIVYVVSNTLVGMFEAPTVGRAVAFLWRMLPVVGKFISVHFTVATLAVWPLLSHLLINTYMWRSWCYVQDLGERCQNCCVPVAAASGRNIGEERVILNSWMVYFQQQANAGLALGLLLAAGMGAFYFMLVKDRVDGDVDRSCVASNALLHWARIELEVLLLGWISSMMFASIPEWIAAVKIIFTLQFHHVVAGMVGRTDGDADLTL